MWPSCELSASCCFSPTRVTARRAMVVTTWAITPASCRPWRCSCSRRRRTGRFPSCWPPSCTWATCASRVWRWWWGRRFFCDAPQKNTSRVCVSQLGPTITWTPAWWWDLLIWSLPLHSWRFVTDCPLDVFVKWLQEQLRFTNLVLFEKFVSSKNT